MILNLEVKNERSHEEDQVVLTVLARKKGMYFSEMHKSRCDAQKQFQNFCVHAVN